MCARSESSFRVSHAHCLLALSFVQNWCFVNVCSRTITVTMYMYIAHPLPWTVVTSLLIIMCTGCFCPNSLLLHGDRCVLPTECPDSLCLLPSDPGTGRYIRCTCMCVCLSFCLSVCRSVCLSVYLSVCIDTCFLCFCIIFLFCLLLTACVDKNYPVCFRSHTWTTYNLLPHTFFTRHIAQVVYCSSSD